MKVSASIDSSKPEPMTRLSASEPTGGTARAEEDLGLGRANVILRTRREALRLMGLAGAAGCAWMNGAAAQPKDAKTGDTSADALDEAYRLLQSDEPRSRRGLATHAPMVVEALCALGQCERAVRWMEDHRAPLRPLPRPSTRIDPVRWRAALGPTAGATGWEAINSRWGDWREFFLGELSERPWRDVLDVWVARLAPGMSGAATHGVIRTAHAVRALALRENSLRRAELARGLAYWASSYEELPTRQRTGPQFQTFARALAEVPVYWEAFGRRPDGGIIVEVLRGVRELDRFADVRDLIAQPADLPAALSALTATFSRVYLRHGTKRDAIAFVHAVTGPCSLRRLAPHIKPETARAALPYAWQAAAAIYSAYARPNEQTPEPEAKLGRTDSSPAPSTTAMNTPSSSPKSFWPSTN